MDFFYAPMRLFVGNPLAIGGVVVILIVIAAIQRNLLGKTRWPMFVAIGLWCLFTIWESLVSAQDQVVAIRIDLLFIWPILLIATIVGLVGNIHFGKGKQG